MNSADLTKFPSTTPPRQGSGQVGASNLPDVPGIYFFLGKRGKILYIGKATSLKDRVKSYFVRDILATRSPLIAKMLDEAEKIEFTETDSALEALLLEANAIKKYQPTYNSKEKDDRSHNYVTITQEDFPKVVVTRGLGTYGPFPHSGELREALKIIRKIFPYRDDKCKITGRPCFNAQVGFCPGVCAGRISTKDYRKIIRHLQLFFEAKKPQLIKSLGKEMKALAKSHKFEEAEKVKRQIFALKHIQDIALIKKDLTTSPRLAQAGQDNQPLDSARGKQPTTFRIEAYDVAHLSGVNAVSVMAVVEDGEPAKSEYRKFKIRADKNHDIANLKETLIRRFAHPEWRLPNLIVVDGGQGQLHAAVIIVKKAGLNIPVTAVVKDERHKARKILEAQGQTFKKLILLANSEAHRFAIGYHRKLRGKEFQI